jgi:ribosome-associated protein
VSDGDPIDVDGLVWIPRSELVFRATRSGGPGGQHVNTSSTRVELTWDVGETPALDESQRARVLEKLGNRIDQRGVLHLSASGSRSQAQNREEAVERFRALLGEALRVPRTRRKTRPPRAAKENRLRAKRLRSEKKRARGPLTDQE